MATLIEYNFKREKYGRCTWIILTIIVVSIAKIGSNNSERLPGFVVHQNVWETEYGDDIKQHGE